MVALVDAFLVENFPKLPEEIRSYVVGILTENADEFSCVDDVYEAVGVHLCGYGIEDVNEACDRLMNILHGNSVRKDDKSSSTTHRKLDEAIHMLDNAGVPATNGATVDSIWMVSKDVRTTVDREKLEKAEARSKEKADKRSGLPSAPRVRTCDVMPTASQASNRQLKAIESAVDGEVSTVGANNSLDVRIDSIDISYGTRQLVKGADLSLVYGRKYGLVGRNGIGKTTLLKMISSGQLVIQPHIRMLSVEQEVEGDDTPVIESVLLSDTKRCQLMQKDKDLQAKINNPATSDAEKTELSNELAIVYQDISNSDFDKAPARAAGILHGLGFSDADQRRPTKEFSGGWRMRVALARALFMRPDVLLLDEPTNMLDMKAIYWLENHLQGWPGTIFVVSHDRNFLNSICTDIINLHSMKLESYRGNYDNFSKTMHEKITQRRREYEAQQQLRQHTQEFIDKFRYNAKRASMVQSRIKMIERLPVLDPVESESLVSFSFPDCELLGPPVLQLDDVWFRYNDTAPFLFENICVGSDSRSRICIFSSFNTTSCDAIIIIIFHVGDNGTGKTTLLKLLMGDLEPTKGFRNSNRRLKIGYFTQHHVDQLDMDVSAIEVAANRFPGMKAEDYRAALGRFGLSGDLALQSVATLSGGQKSRLAFALLGLLNPNYMVFDEPSNHLDVETVEALGVALNKFKGGVILVSHDERLIELVCSELWVVDRRTVTKLEGGITEYKKLIQKQLVP